MERASCDPNLLAAYLEDRLHETDKQRLLGHLAACVDCRGTLALLGRAASAGGLSLPPVPQRAPLRPAWRVAVHSWLPLAASLAIATAIAVRLVPRSPTAPGPRAVEPASPPKQDFRSSPAAEPSVTSNHASAPGSEGPHRPPPGAIDESLLVKRGATRRVGERTFRSVAGEWVDTRFDPDAAFPIVTVKGAHEREALLSRIPDLAPYAQLGDRVVVIFEGTVYRFSP
jgi:hypothetical protein